ncbi:MAG TPA: hypothetical protein VGJ29_03585 [Vicinamibacterales bacterium]
MKISRFRRFAASSLLISAALARTAPAAAQVVSERGFVDGSAWLFPQAAPNDSTRLVGDLLVRDEIFVKPGHWIQFAVGVDLRANSHDQVDARWRVDFTDRDPLRPAIAVRRLSASLNHGPLTVDVGKQFIRWGKTDIVTPTDRFAPRDFLNVVDTEFLPVTGLRAVVQLGSSSVDAIWVPFFTPSRTPLVDERWTAVPPAAADLRIVDNGSEIPRGSQVGLRVAHTGSAIEYAFSVFDGFNNLPNLDAAAVFSPQPGSPTCSACSQPAVAIRRVFPSLRTYGADAAVPTRWLTIKGETALFGSPSGASDEYVLYVVQVERQTGEWLVVGGYAGEIVTLRRAVLTFAPDRGMTRSLVGRASYTIDTNRSLAFETAVRQTGDGLYARAEYSQARGEHWRTTIAAAAIAGHSDDFLGQYHRNSYVTASVRYSF